MFIRTKHSTAQITTRSAFFSFIRGELGIKQTEGIVTAQDGLDMELIAAVPLCLTQDNEDKGVPWTFSTFDLDRYDERIDPEGWGFAHYMKNPVIEWAHRYDIPAIGKAEKLYTDEKGLHGSIVFNDKDYDPFGWAIGERVKNGVIRAGSVGFRILEIELPSKEDSKDGTTLIFRKQELLEFSICNVPANPFALSKTAELDGSKTIPAFWAGFIQA
jgi:HK97 family phage prohead protease